MNTFLRENPTIAFGLGLPLLFVIAFIAISGIPYLLVAPPQYDVIYATKYNHYQSGIQISVVKQKAQIYYQGGAHNNQKPRLWRYNSKTGAVQEISFILPGGLSINGKKRGAKAEVLTTTLASAPELDSLTLDSSSIAADGYEFSLDNRYSRHAFGGLFFSSRNRYEAALIKNGRRVRLPNINGYYRNNIQFIGWVISS
ncbi:MAG: hypothetical protein PSN04_02115 [Methyloprofundus sp.]|nr:hypothetical protein [Methyloprofundus sp.]